MGFRFRKSFKIAPGVKFNINKKSVGLTLGKRGAHFTINSKGKRTTSVGIPGTGLSYTHTSKSRKKAKTSTTKNYTHTAQNTAQIVRQDDINNLSPLAKKLYRYIYLGIGLFLVVWGFIEAFSAPIFIVFSLLGLKLINKSRQYSIMINQDDTLDDTLIDTTPAESSENISILDGATSMEQVSHRLNIPTYLRQVEETMNIIKNSKNADTVVSRFVFLESLRDRLQLASYNEVDGIINTINSLLSIKIDLINLSIKRNLDSELEKINQLKTQKGKENRLNRFFDAMKTIENLPEENLSFIEELELNTKIS